jgi:hypothetical protein
MGRALLLRGMICGLLIKASIISFWLSGRDLEFTATARTCAENSTKRELANFIVLRVVVVVVVVVVSKTKRNGHEEKDLVYQ